MRRTGTEYRCMYLVQAHVVVVLRGGKNHSPCARHVEPPSTTMTGMRRGRRPRSSFVGVTSAPCAVCPTRSRRRFRDAFGVSTAMLAGPLDAPATGVVGPLLGSGGASVRTSPVVAETHAVSLCTGSSFSCSRNASSRTTSCTRVILALHPKMGQALLRIHCARSSV